MRTVKTAVGVMVSYLVFAPFGLIYQEQYGGLLGYLGPLYACIACIVCMQSSLGQTVQQGLSRLMGVAIGGALGILFLTLGPTLAHPAVQTLALGLVCIMGIWISLLLRRPAACAMACILPCVIIVGGYTGVHRYYYAGARIIETVVGVIIAFGVNALLPDHRHEPELGPEQPPTPPECKDE